MPAAKKQAGTKEIRFQSVSPITVKSDAFVKAIAELQKKVAKRLGEDAGKMPDAKGMLSAIGEHVRVFTARDASHGAVSVSIHYQDEDDCPSTFNFPNYGLVVDGSGSSIMVNGKEVSIVLDVTVKPGKPKWQVDEVAKFAKALSSGRFEVAMKLCLDEATDPFGDSLQLPTSADVPSDMGLPRIPGSVFKVTCS